MVGSYYSQKELQAMVREAIARSIKKEHKRIHEIIERLASNEVNDFDTIDRKELLVELDKVTDKKEFFEEI